MHTQKSQPVVFSGIQPSGNLTIGNYIGAIRNWVSLVEEYNCIFSIVDLHAITIRREPAELKARCYEFLALYIACGVDPDRCTIMVQSHVPPHAQLAWVLGCFTGAGELRRMTQFKEKSRKNRTSVSAGLLNYPVLMAADILLYGTDLVPVGEDQKQHLELARDIAGRFNAVYGNTFKIPDVYMPPVGARIMSLSDPTRKMDKSDKDPRNYIALLDSTDLVVSKIKRAVTDSGTEVAYDESRPAISNLVAIYSGLSGEPVETIEDRYAGKTYARFKSDLAELINETLRPIQRKFKELEAESEELDRILRDGAAKAARRSAPMIDAVFEKVGFIPRFSRSVG